MLWCYVGLHCIILDVIHTCVYIYIYIYIHLLHTGKYIMCLHLSLSLCVYIYIYIYVHIYTYLYTHTHTILLHTSTGSSSRITTPSWCWTPPPAPGTRRTRSPRRTLNTCILYICRHVHADVDVHVDSPRRIIDWIGTPRPQPQTFSNLVFLIRFSWYYICLNWLFGTLVEVGGSDFID